MAILVLSVLAMMVGICPVSRAAEGKDESWKVPVYNYEQALAKAKEHGNNYVAKEYYERLCLAFGPPNASAKQWLDEDLCWLLCRNFKEREAMEYAQYCWATYGNLASLLRVADAFYVNGAYEKAREILRGVEANMAGWGGQFKEQEPYLELLKTLLAARTFRCTYAIPAANLKDRKSVVLTTPLTMPPWQVLKKCEIQGISSSEKKTTIEGDPYLVVKPIPGSDIKIIADVIVTPVSNKELASQYRDGPLPEDVKKYLSIIKEKSGAVRIDPNGPIAKQLAAQLRGKSAFETSENIMRWMRANWIGGVLPEWPKGVSHSEFMLSTRKGDCQSFTEAFITLARACGIPSRALRGHSGFWQDKGNFAQHTIPEFYLNGIGWTTWDGGMPILCTMPNELGRYHYLATVYGDQDTGVDLSFMDWSEMHNGTATYQPIEEKL